MFFEIKAKKIVSGVEFIKKKAILYAVIFLKGII